MKKYLVVVLMLLGVVANAKSIISMDDFTNHMLKTEGRAPTVEEKKLLGDFIGCVDKQKLDDIEKKPQAEAVAKMKELLTVNCRKEIVAMSEYAKSKKKKAESNKETSAPVKK